MQADRARMQEWQAEMVAIDNIAIWAGEKVTGEWGKKAPARVFHICDAGKNIEIEDPLHWEGNRKTGEILERVPGFPERATTKSDLSQGLSFVATHRRDAEERVSRRAKIPQLLECLAASSPA